LFYANLEVVQDDDPELVLLSSVDGHTIAIDLQIISQFIEVPVLQISGSPYNEVVLPHSLDDLIDFSMLSLRERSATLPSGSVPYLPHTACLPRLSSTTSGPLLGAMI
jgi:hypothetical protein